jgi:hypothetical protein
MFASRSSGSGRSVAAAATPGRGGGGGGVGLGLGLGPAGVVRRGPPFLPAAGVGGRATLACSSSTSTAAGGRSSRCNACRCPSTAFGVSSAHGPARSSSRATVRGSTSRISAVASTEQPCVSTLSAVEGDRPRDRRHRPLRVPHQRPLPLAEPAPAVAVQYSRRMALRLPIRSHTDRSPAPKRSRRFSLSTGSPRSCPSRTGIAQQTSTVGRKGLP